jgi:hypothetical protein
MNAPLLGPCVTRVPPKSNISPRIRKIVIRMYSSAQVNKTAQFKVDSFGEARFCRPNLIYDVLHVWDM